MSRQRTLKPAWLDSEKLASCNDATRLLSTGLMLLADDWGCGRASPVFVRNRVWAYRDKPLSEVEESLRELHAIGYVEFYEVDGQRYFKICNWDRHQYVKYPSKTLRNPTPEVGVAVTCADSSPNPEEGLPSSSSNPGPTLVNDRTGQDRKGKDLSCSNAKWRPNQSDLDEIYQKYPRKAGKAKGMEKAKEKIRSPEALEKLRDVVEQMAKAWEGANTKFCPLWSTFVNGKRWEDEEIPKPANGHSPPRLITPPRRRTLEESAGPGVEVWR